MPDMVPDTMQQTKFFASNRKGLWSSAFQHHEDTAGVMTCLCSEEDGLVSPAFIRAT